MNTFHLSITTPDGLFFDGEAESLRFRATTGEMTILAHHMDFVAAIGMGPATVTTGGVKRRAACIGGMVAVTGGEVHLIATTFEWAENIDRERAKIALQRAEENLKDPSLTKEEQRMEEAARRRALVRLNV